MIFLFEDKEEDTLSCLLRKSFDTNSIPFVYANGNGRLVEKATELLEKEDIIIVLLDTVPANKSIRDVYLTLRRLSRKNDFRIIIWNIVCAEYYFIKAFGEIDELKAFESKTDIGIIKSRDSYLESCLIATDEDRAFTKTFEKFCKLYILKNGGECINKSKIFFLKDCGQNESCRNLSNEEKSEMYRREYGCFKASDCSVEEAWEIHEKLLEEANEMIVKYNHLGYKEILPYPTIKCNQNTN